MQDEHFMRDWAGAHDRFSANAPRRAQAGLGREPEERQSRTPIGGAYAVGYNGHAKAALSPVARASLRGFAASVLTFVLWVTVMALATPTPGLASPLVDAADCAVRPVLA